MTRPYRTRRPWTEADDDLLRKFHAEKKTDRDIGYILDRHHQVVFLRRKVLKLPSVAKRGAHKGWHHTADAKARIGASNSKRWQDPEYRASHAPLILTAQKIWQETCFRRPPKGTPEEKLYRKLMESLGPERARQEMNLA